MTGTCCVCKKSYKYSSIHLFRFPFKNPVKLRKWVDAVKTPGFWPSKSTRICSDHFLDTDYDINPHTKIPRLRDCAVPGRNLGVCRTAKPRLLLAKPSLAVGNSINQTSGNQISKIICLTDISSLNKAIQKTNLPGPVILRSVPPLVPVSSGVKKDVSTQMAVSSSYLNKIKQTKPSSLNVLSSRDVSKVEVPNMNVIGTQTIGIQAELETEKEMTLKRKVKMLQHKVRQKEQKICCLREVLYALKERGALEPDASELIDHYFDDSE